MLKRFALMFAATAVLAIPTTGAFAAPSPAADGVLPPGSARPPYCRTFPAASITDTT